MLYQRRAAQSQSAAEDYLATAAVQTADLVKRIANRETTGDRITDLVIRRYGQVNLQYESAYRSIESRLSKNKGQFILVASRREAFNGCSGFFEEPKNSDYQLELQLSLGLIQSDKIVIGSHGGPEIPTGDHAEAHIDSWRHRVESREGNIYYFYFHGHDLALDLDQPLTIRNPYTLWHQPDQPLRLEIVMGYKDVTDWFAKQPSPPVYRQIFAEMVGKFTDEEAVRPV